MRRTRIAAARRVTRRRLPKLDANQARDFTRGPGFESVERGFRSDASKQPGHRFGIPDLGSLRDLDGVLELVPKQGNPLGVGDAPVIDPHQ